MCASGLGGKGSTVFCFYLHRIQSIFSTYYRNIGYPPLSIVGPNIDCVSFAGLKSILATANHCFVYNKIPIYF